MISFAVSKNDAEVIAKIAQRASKAARKCGFRYSVLEASMDVTACHANGTPLKLEEFLKADEFDFTHDAFGIRRHIDRNDGNLKDCFLPRYAQ
jgi:hypothetical protein